MSEAAFETLRLAPAEPAHAEAVDDAQDFVAAPFELFRRFAVIGRDAQWRPAVMLWHWNPSIPLKRRDQG
jgi:hypothetical protein